MIAKLLVVQELDAKILALRAKLERGPQRLEAEKAQLEQHQSRYEDASRRAKEAMRLAERKNSELEEVDRKMKDLGMKQNTARSNKEYEALKVEIAGLKADFELLEEEALQQWSIGDEREKEAAKVEEAILDTSQQFEEKTREWEEEARGLEVEFEELGAERADKARNVPSSWMDTYEKVVESRGTPAVVAVEAQYCLGCQMRLSIHDVTRAIRGAEIVQCKACNRILFADAP
ncbi:MAG: zinc ribbon domain-containing protein [Planctomycetota bacterium]